MLAIKRQPRYDDAQGVLHSTDRCSYGASSRFSYNLSKAKVVSVPLE